jgi:type IX secretion system substrate protein
MKLKTFTLIISLFTFLTQTVYAQPNQQWLTTYNGAFNGADVINDMEVDQLGNVYVCGATDTFGASTDYVVLKYSNSGNLLWEYKYNGPANAEDVATALAFDASGHVYVTGRSKGIATQYDYATIKINKNTGKQIWITRYNNASQNLDDAAVDIQVSGFQVVVLGYSFNNITSFSEKDFFLISYDQYGIKMWDYKWGSTSEDEPVKLMTGNNGIVYAIGARGGSNNSYYSALALNIISGSYAGSMALNNLWGNSYSKSFDIVQDGSGDVYLTGSWVGRIIVNRFNGSMNNEKWKNYYAYNGLQNEKNRGLAIDLSSSGDVYVTGRADKLTSTPESFDMMVLRYDANGVGKDTVLYGQVSNKDDEGIDIQVDRYSNPSVYVLAQSENAQSKNEMKVIKYSKDLVQQWVYTYSCPNGDVYPIKFYLDDFDNITVAGYQTCGSTQEDIFVLRICTKTPTAEAGLNDTICKGDSVRLNGTGNGSYSWFPSTGLSNPNVANPMVAPTQTTTYYLSVSYGGCVDMDSVTVTVLPAPTVTVTPNSSVCAGQSVQLNATGGVSYQWSPGTSLNNPNIANPTANPASTTIYTVTVTNAAGCQNTATTQVTVNLLPTANAGQDVAICTGQSTTLNATGGVSYLWSPNTGLNFNNISNPVASPSSTTVYTVTVTNANGCTDQDVVRVTVNPLPTANAGNDIELCQGASTLLNATGGVSCSWGPATGLNFTNLCSPTATPIFTTTYTVTVTDINGCKAQDMVKVTVNPLPTANAGSDVAICFGDNIQLSGSGGVGYSWAPVNYVNNPSIPNPIATPDSTMSFTLTVVDSNGCQNQDIVKITVNPEFATAGADEEICFGDSVQLGAQGGTTYLWTPAAGLSDPNIADPLAFPPSTTTYTVKITDANNCSKSDNLTVTVLPLPPKPTIVFSNSTLTSSATSGNQWYFNGAIIPGATSQTYSPQNQGIYSVVVTGSNGCSNESEPFIFTGIGDLDNDFGISVYPNPSDGILNVSVNEAGEYTISVYNLLGEVLYAENIAIDQDGGHRIDVSDLSQGYYILKIIEDDKSKPNIFPIVIQ